MRQFLLGLLLLPTLLYGSEYDARFLRYVDNDEATTQGVWYSSASTRGYQGTNYLHDSNTGKGNKSVVYRPRLDTNGEYLVSIWYPANTNYSTNTPVDVVWLGGSNTVYINQRENGKTWFPLGHYGFSAGTDSYVRVRTTGTSGYVIADAVCFTYTNGMDVFNTWQLYVCVDYYVTYSNEYVQEIYEMLPNYWSARIVTNTYMWQHWSGYETRTGKIKKWSCTWDKHGTYMGEYPSGSFWFTQRLIDCWHRQPGAPTNLKLVAIIPGP